MTDRWRAENNRAILLATHNSARRHKILAAVATHSVLIAASIIFLAPFIVISLTALMTGNQALTSHIWPQPFQWHNFVAVFEEEPILLYIWNTLQVAGLSTVGVVLSCIPAAYALSRMRWRGRGFAFMIILSTLMLPFQVTVVPLYLIFAKLEWIGTLKPLIVPNFFGDAFSIFLLRQFFMTVPQDLTDAARIDGAGEFQIMTRLIVPLAKPAIAAVALFQFLYQWDDFFAPLLYVGNNPKLYTLTIGLQQFQSNHNTMWNMTMAAAVIFMVPVIVIFFLAQKVFVQGITMTGIK